MRSCVGTNLGRRRLRLSGQDLPLVRLDIDNVLEGYRTVLYKSACRRLFPPWGRPMMR
jgi:hypothetical protein